MLFSQSVNENADSVVLRGDVFGIEKVDELPSVFIVFYKRLLFQRNQRILSGA